MYCPAQALTSTGATERALERHNLLCPRQDYTRSNLSETITLVESSKFAGLTAGTSRGHFSRAPGILLFGTSAICGLRKQRGACRKEVKSITAVALDRGFGHAQHFIAAFRRVTGLTPLDVPPCLSLLTRLRTAHLKAAAPTPYLPLPGDVCLLASKACLSCLPGTREASQRRGHNAQKQSVGRESCRHRRAGDRSPGCVRFTS
jgi:AraC-like DNA-binding protein